MYRKMIRTFASFCLTLCLVGVMPLRAAAWGRDGHQIVAGIALWRLQQTHAKNALNNIESILKSNLEAPMLRQPTDLFSAAVWPDDVRGTDEYRFADDLHFVSIPLDRQNAPNALDEYDKTGSAGLQTRFLKFRKACASSAHYSTTPMCWRRRRAIRRVSRLSVS